MRSCPRHRPLRAALSGLLLTVAGCGDGEPARVRLATTAAIVEVGLAAALIEAFQAGHPEITVELLPDVDGVFEQVRRGDADVLFTNAPVEEARLMAENVLTDRRVVMHSEFVLLGPPEDPADIAGIADAGEALRIIASAGMRFVMRNAGSASTPDRALWSAIGIAPVAPWAIEGGPGIADALRLASAQRAYVLSDLAGFLALAPTLELEIVSQGDARLADTYAVARALAASSPRAAQTLADWLAGPEARALMEDHVRDPFGAPVFRGAPPSGTARRVEPPSEAHVARVDRAPATASRPAPRASWPVTVTPQSVDSLPA